LDLAAVGHHRVWAILEIIPLVREIFGGTGYSLLASTIGLTIFITPTCTLLFYRSYLTHLDQFEGLEKSFQMSALSRSELFIKSQPTAVIGTTNYIFCRIFGETMVVLMLSGNSVQIPGNFLDGFRSLTATIALEMSYATGMHETALFRVGDGGDRDHSGRVVGAVSEPGPCLGSSGNNGCCGSICC
jgi:phosphate transport system permease protein